MIALLIAHIIITACCLWTGFLFYRSVSKENVQRPIIFYLVSGLILFTILVQIIVLFFPIGSMTQLVLGIILFATAVLKWNDCKKLFKRAFLEISVWPTLSLILFLLTWLVVLLVNAGPTMMDDTESYHIQSVKWIQEYGSVPGLVNLHERFGFNSSWFSSVALFGFSSKTTGGFTVLNSVLSMWLCYWFIAKYNQYQKENNMQAAFAVLIIFIACLLIWPLVRGNAATTNYDFITTVVVLILFTEIFFNKKNFSFYRMDNMAGLSIYCSGDQFSVTSAELNRFYLSYKTKKHKRHFFAYRLLSIADRSLSYKKHNNSWLSFLSGNLF